MDEGGCGEAFVAADAEALEGEVEGDEDDDEL